jgi:hypothetical protein
MGSLNLGLCQYGIIIFPKESLVYKQTLPKGLLNGNAGYSLTEHNTGTGLASS